MEVLTINNLYELENIYKVKNSSVKPTINDFCNSEIIAEIEYYGGLKVTVLQLAQDFVITYELSHQKWNSNCKNTDEVLTDVKTKIDILKNTKLLPLK